MLSVGYMNGFLLPSDHFTGYLTKICPLNALIIPLIGTFLGKNPVISIELHLTGNFTLG